jgi:leader peptidase (prepilin peptidase) / N-methyltransferase
MLIVSVVLFVLIGLVIGSFLNVVIDRLPAGQSLAFPPSHCPSCQRRLTKVDLIPVVSYLRLKGRCRVCASPIPARIFWVELTTGLAFGLLYLYLGLSPELGVSLFYYCLLVVIAVIDIEKGLILNWLVYPGMVVALICSIFATQLAGDQVVVPSLARAAIGGGAGFILFLLIVLLSRGGMGIGDIEMAAFMGIMLGFPYILVGIFLAIVIGGLVAVGLLVTGVKGRKQTVPFGPFLAAGAFLALLWGPTFLNWYLRLFGSG